MSESQAERNQRTYANHIRRRFLGHAQTVRDFVANMSDADLIAMEAQHIETRKREIAAKAAKTVKS